MDPNELERDLADLWRRVHGGAPEVPSAAPAYEPLRRRQDEERAELEEMLEAREKALSGMTGRLAEAQSEAAKLKARLEREQDLFLEQMMSASSSLEEAQRSLASSREDRERELAAAQKRHQDEVRQVQARHEAELEALRKELGLAAKRLEEEKVRFEEADRYWKALEKKWREREAQLQARTHGLDADLKKAFEAAEATERSAKKAAERASQLEAALQKTLSELQGERLASSQAKDAEAAARAKVDELDARLKEQQAAWEEERRQWREMWDREHSAWESQRQEFEGWEERLRREREAWLEAMRSKEAEEVEAAARLTEVLKNTGEWVERSRAAAEAPPPEKLGRSPVPPAVWAASAGMLAATLAIAGYFSLRPSLKLEAEHSVALKRPTALAASADRLWFAEWDGPIVAAPVSDPERPAQRAAPPAPFHPLALAWSSGALWSLDAATARAFRHDPADPGRLAGAPLAPAATVPTAAAFDGKELWIFDAASGLVWRQSPGGAARSAPTPAGTKASSLHWSGEALWAYDSKSGALVRLDVEGDALRAGRRIDVPDRPVAVALFERALWTLSPAGQDRFTLRRYRVR